MPTLYLHIGAPKTATTYLQKNVLPELEKIQYFVKPTIQLDEEEVAFGDLFDFSPEVWKNEGGKELASLIGSSNQNQDTIISDERIFGALPSPQPWLPPPRHARVLKRPRRFSHGRPDPHFVASHLRELAETAKHWGYEETKILLTIRRQDTKLASSYAQLSNRIRRASQKGFEEWIEYITTKHIGYYKGGMNLDYFLWWKEISRFIDEENILFTPFEQLKYDKIKFIDKWVDFLGLRKYNIDNKKVKKRSNDSFTWKLRKPIRKKVHQSSSWILRLFKLPNILFRLPDFSRDKTIKLDASLSSKVLEVYKEKNEKLDKLIEHIDLKKYGYY